MHDKMNNTLPKEQLDYYQNFDFEKVELVEPNVIKQIKARKKLAEEQNFDIDVLAWIDSQDSVTKRHVNDVLRHMMALKSV